MSIISSTDLQNLAQKNSPFAVSIYIPTHRFGKETIVGEDAIKLKNQLKEVRQSLLGLGKTENEVKKYLQPAVDLLNSPMFWKNQSDGLAIFIAEDLFKIYQVPVRFEAFNYISNEFYLKPLMPYFNEDGKFYLLNLEVDNVLFYECDKHNVTKIDLSDELPNQLEDVVGYDYEQKYLQKRTQQGNMGQGQFHGHSDNDTDRKKELIKYFRKIDKVIVNVMNESGEAPLVVACSDFHFGLYKKVNSWHKLYAKNITQTMKNNDVFLLHEQACIILKPIFAAKKNEKLETFMELQGTGKSSKDIHQIIPAAFNGQVDALFIENKADVFGKFNPKDQTVKVSDQRTRENRSLLNFAATQVMLNGGKVYLLDKENMPNKKSKINALYRY